MSLLRRLQNDSTPPLEARDGSDAPRLEMNSTLSMPLTQSNAATIARLRRRRTHF
jgi:hypothetical protein